MSASSCCPPPSQKPACSPSAEQPAEAGTAACSAAAGDAATCCPPVRDDRPGYQLWPFVCGWLDTPAGRIPRLATQLSFADISGRWQMRWGLGRSRYSIAPGLYAIGTPAGASPVLVTANYKMTFDILRRDLQGHDVWLLVLDSKGINVWCAAGKGTFGSDELLRQVRNSNLQQVVEHRTLILPQLGAPGIAAHKVAKGCGFKVIYGPVRSSDLPRFLADGQKASAAMRRVTFDFVDRLVLTPVELVNMRRQILGSLLLLFMLGGIGRQIFSFAAAWQRGGSAAAAGLLGVLTGAVLVPALLPWLPGRMFAMKGAIAGLLTALPVLWFFHASLGWLNALALLALVAAVASWCAMHFTGSSTFTSPSGVAKEMRRAIPAQAAALLVGGICWLAGAF